MSTMISVYVYIHACVVKRSVRDAMNCSKYVRNHGTLDSIVCMCSAVGSEICSTFQVASKNLSYCILSRRFLEKLSTLCLHDYCLLLFQLSFMEVAIL